MSGSEAATLDAAQGSDAASGYRVLPLRAESWNRHRFHGTDRIWAETNCYVDLWTEYLHGLGLDPVQCLGFTLGIDFEGDQWTFFKFPLEDLRTMYGVEVQEFALWRPLEEHLLEQGGFGRTMIVEIDAWFLPDTAGISYRKEHTKTSIVVNALDPGTKTIGYFHGPGYFEATGEDYDGLLRIGGPERWNPEILPPYAEIVKTDRMVRRSDDEARPIARTLLAAHLERRTDNGQAMERFLARLRNDLAGLRSGEMSYFHGYAFATLRQLGAAAELAGDHLDWLGIDPQIGTAFRDLATAAKALQFKLARVAAGRDTNLDQVFDDLRSAWDRGMITLLSDPAAAPTGSNITARGSADDR